MKKSVIYQFKVYSPYDGCHWCWAYVYVDSEKVPHFLKFENSTHWNKQLDHYSNDKNYHGSYGYTFNTERACKRDFISCLKSNEVYCYGINSKKDIEELLNECNEQDIITILTELQSTYDIDIKLKCRHCGEEVSASEMQSTGYHGDGGIGIEYTDYICNDCYLTNTCESCNEYDENLNEHGLCLSCSEVECIICGGYSSDCNIHDVCEDCITDDRYIKSLKSFNDKVSQWIEDKNSQLFFPDTDSIKSPDFILLNT